MNQRGFSLVELIIVVLIIGIIATIAIPNLLASRRAANEGSTISTIRTLHGAQITYAGTTGSGNFAGSSTIGTTGLSTLSSNRLIDTSFNAGIKHGYQFRGKADAADTSAAATFHWSAVPVTSTGAAATGKRRFGIGTHGTINYSFASLTTHFPDYNLSGGVPLN